MVRLISTLAFVLWAVAGTYCDLSYEWGCESYLERASYSNSIELAEQNLDAAIGYMESNGMTHGSTGILFHTPSKDVGFWYQNIKTAQEQLRALGPNASELEKSNMLMKLRETILTHGEKGEESVISPSGVSVFPYNVIFFIWGWLSGIVAVIAWVFGGRK